MRFAFLHNARRFVKILSVGTLLSLSAMALLTTGAPTAAVNADGADVYGVGGGSISLEGFHHFVTFSFSAHDGPRGDFGSARVTITDPQPPLDVRVDVDCVKVEPFLTGGNAIFAGVVKKVSPVPNAYDIDEGDRLLFVANDFGNPSGPVADELQVYLEDTDCETLPPSSGLPITNGNINIKLPAPTLP